MRLLSRLLVLLAALAAGIVARPAPARAQARPRPGSLPGTPPARPDSVRADTIRSDAARRDTTRRDSTGRRLPGATADTTWDPLRALNVQFEGRTEAKLERVRDKRCATGQSFALTAGCRTSFPPPAFDFPFSIKADGNVLERLHLTVDFDTKREFDASNVIRLSYEGKPDARIGRVEVGNVSFAPPASRFITGGIPSNNYGLHALGRAGRVRWRAIAAQQRGNVVNGRVFTVGAGGGAAVQTQERPIEDFEVEARRFFFTIDPRTIPGWPNVDILDRAQLARIAAALPDTVRPTRVVVYRQLVGAQVQNPRGPRLAVRGARNERRQTYEVLRENVDYYLDPSQLWIALVRPLSLNSERLAVAYEVTVGGRRTRWLSTGGTPDVEFSADSQVANLLWEPELAPGEPAFFRELRNVYRVGGEDVRRETVALRVVTGTAGDQEAPVDASGGATYLQLFGLAQPASPTTFDVENRLWPRPQDPNANAAQPGTKLIRDYFVVFPSAQPFARAGLVRSAANPANDTIYTYPSEFLNSTQRPQRVYRMRLRYEAEGAGAVSTLMIGAVQLRPGSERLTANGRPLLRDVDYTIDYELGMVTFLRAESLFPTTTDVAVRYEENPILFSQPTSVFAAAAELPTRAGSVFFTALAQRQGTKFNRPQLGYEQSESMVAGVGADLAWDAPFLSRLAGRLTALSRPARAARGAAAVLGDSAALPRSRISVRGELAASKPRASNGMQAYLESFEGEGGFTLPTNEAGWYFSSRPPVGAALAARGLGPVLVNARAATLTWQRTVTAVGSRVQKSFRIDSIDPAIALSRGAALPTEPVLWLSLFPLSVGGQPAADTLLGREPFRWTVPDAPSGQRWRSIRTLLNAGGSGVDVTRAEMLEFYALVRTGSPAERARNPVLVFDFGSVSENTVSVAPDSLIVSGADSLYRGRQVVGLGHVDTERDTLSRAFNASANDVGLPGDRAPLTVIENGARRVVPDAPLCRALLGAIRPLGDPRTNCTRENSRLDEEDIDQDGTLSIDESNESIRRYVVDLRDPAVAPQTGPTACTDVPAGLGDGLGAGATAGQRCWVRVRIPFRAPVDSTPGFNERRVRALRLTMISSRDEPDGAFTRIALARIRLTGAPWLKRAGRALSGAGGDSAGTLGSYVIASTIGTQDPTYTSPPGVTEQTEQRRTGFEVEQEQINERSMRLQAGAPGGSLAPFERAEAFFRFPEGIKNVMTYRQLRLWLRGVRGGWGPGGELNAYVKLGRDEDNFYMYRTEVNAGGSPDAWLPEVRVDFARFYRLRVALQEAFLTGRLPGDGRYECRGVDAELVRRSGLPRGVSTRRWAACDGGYMIYTVDPNVSPPNLAQLQEVAVGMVRVDSAARGGNPIVPNDTLELWVDDVRLAEAEDAAGMAAEISASAQIGDLAELRVGLARRDPHFRQLAEAPTFVTSNDVSLAATVRLDKLLPNRFGLAVPLTIVHTGAGSVPLFVSGSDLRGATVGGLRTPRDATTSYALTLRRATPLAGPLGPILNNLSVTSTYVAGQARSTYQGSSRHAFSLRADYDLTGAARSLVAPGAVPAGFPGEGPLGAPAPAGGVRWSPTTFRLTSQLARSGNRQQSFLKPLAAPDDTGQVVTGLENVWRHSAVVEFHPVPALTARWDASTLRDLREYDDLPIRGGPGADSIGFLRGEAVRRERARLGFLDLGFERERLLNGTLELTPTLPRVSRWLKPRAQATSSYTMTRDPNARSLLGPGDLFADTVDVADTSGAAQLPRRLGSQQLLSAGVAVDLGRVLLDRAGPDTTARRGLRRLAALFQPIDVAVSRTLTSAFDATIADPALGTQLGLAGPGAFRTLDGRAATAAGLVNRVTVTNTLALPFGFTVTNRLEGGTTRTWWRRALTNAQVEGTGTQRVSPDLSVRWSWRPAWAAAVFSDLSATAGYFRQRQTSRAPGDSLSPADERAARAERFPASMRVTWPWLGGLTTLAGASLRRQTDELPGARTTSTTRERNAELRRAFRPPARWGLKSDITTSAGFSLGRTRALITPLALLGADSAAFDVRRIVQADVGQQTLTFNAHSDVAESLTLSLDGARVLRFNNNINQRLVQTVFTASLQLNFFPGQFR